MADPTKVIPNILDAATSGDPVDVRDLELTGIEDLTGATVEAWVWKPRTERAAVPAVVTSPTTVEVDLGPWLATNPVAADWLFEINVEGTTWPGARKAALLPVRTSSA